MVQLAQQSQVRKRLPTDPLMVQPQRKWEEARKRMQKQAKRLANVVLNHVELKQVGNETEYKYKHLKLSAGTITSGH
jgi:DNA repair protein RadD